MVKQLSVQFLFILFLFVLWSALTIQVGVAASPSEPGQVYLPLVVNNSNSLQTATPVATPTATSIPSTPPATPAALPLDQALIAAGLAQGKIDYGTSLLYRFYSLFADDRLPSDYRGSGSIGEDQALFAEAVDPALSAEVQAKLRPFLLRPDDPGSIHTLQAQGKTGQVVAQSVSVPCAGAWAALSSAKPGVKVRVHALCLNNYAQDIQTALAMIESLWQPMTTMMGPPLPDLGGEGSGSTDEIDFYLLDPLGVVWREGENQDITAGALAVAPSAEPFLNDRSSGFVLLARHDLGTPGFKSTLAHEFFHVLQKAHNRSICFHGPVEWWFGEASAKWAEWYFAPETSAREVHSLFTNTFRSADQPLHRSYEISSIEKLHEAFSAYAGYIWPFFVQQEQGQASMGKIWQALEKVGSDWNKGLGVLDEDYPFALHFHRFAFRNLNSRFAGDNPLGKRYVDLDPNFPDDWLPFGDIEEDLMPAPSARIFTDTIPALRAHYYHFNVKDAVRQVTFDLTALQPLLDRKVGAVIKIKGKPWQMRELVSDVLTFCRSNPNENIEEIWFVVSHDKTDLSKTVSGSIKVNASDQACGCNLDTWAKYAAVNQWQAHISYSYERYAAAGKQTVQIQESGSINAKLDKMSQVSHLATLLSGQVQMSYLGTEDGQVVDQVSGSGEPVNADPFGGQPSRIKLDFNPEDCTYAFFAGVKMNGTNKKGEPLVVSGGSVNGWFRPLPGGTLSLQGSATFDAHSYLYIVTHRADFFYSDYDAVLTRMVGESELGKATVTWSFTPVTNPPQVETAQQPTPS